MKLRKKANWMRFVAGASFLALSLLVSGLKTAQAADAVSVGIIDEAELGEKFTKYRAELKALEDRAKMYDNQLKAREVLNATDAKRFDELINRVLKEKKTRTAAEDKEMETLTKTGKDRAARFTETVGKEKRTPDDDKFVAEVKTSIEANKKSVRDLEDLIFDTLKKEDEETNKTYIDQANKMVEKIAIQKKLTVVFRKDAVVWFAPAIDLTADVIKELNKQ